MRIVTAIFCCISLCSMASYARADQSSGDEALARRLLNSQGCKACHSFEGGTTQTGPPLEEISQQLNRAQIYNQLVNPAGEHGNGLIPDFSHLSDKEIQALVSFLHTLRPEAAAQASNPKTGSQD